MNELICNGVLKKYHHKQFQKVNVVIAAKLIKAYTKKGG